MWPVDKSQTRLSQDSSVGGRCCVRDYVILPFSHVAVTQRLPHQEFNGPSAKSPWQASLKGNSRSCSISPSTRSSSFAPLQVVFYSNSSFKKDPWCKYYYQSLTLRKLNLYIIIRQKTSSRQGRDTVQIRVLRSLLCCC